MKPFTEEVLREEMEHLILPEIERQTELTWEPLLFCLCSDLSFMLRKIIQDRYPDVTVEVMTGTWKGPVSEKFVMRMKADDTSKTPMEHNWLKVTSDDRSWLIDPTYVQFTGEAVWSFEKGLAHAEEFCQDAAQSPLTAA